MKTELQKLNSFGLYLYELMKGNEDLLTNYIGLGIQYVELLNNVNGIISQKENELKTNI